MIEGTDRVGEEKRKNGKYLKEQEKEIPSE
jgi:hypothetical protein